MKFKKIIQEFNIDYIQARNHLLQRYYLQEKLQTGFKYPYKEG